MGCVECYIPLLQIITLCSCGHLTVPKMKVKGLWVVSFLLLCSVTKLFGMVNAEMNETEQEVSQNGYNDIGVTRNKIVTAQFECYQKIMKDTNHNRKAQKSCLKVLSLIQSFAGMKLEYSCVSWFLLYPIS
ncbi:hypothetical protein JZ751_027901 [Albula glossodonta]|uniref:Uncharacterized protein n=1 Tax=Albula glossodonta TaxID=121402 RepID=A0A8T2PCI6_9TELE|nr:hypothetical protein JZ751_027901 [Albula glossodonta]